MKVKTCFITSAPNKSDRQSKISLEKREKEKEKVEREKEKERREGGKENGRKRQREFII